MAAPYEPPQGFPDGSTGADVFVREFPTAVTPADRAYLMTRPPLFILRVEEGAEYRERVGRVVEELRKPLDHHGKLVPYAVVTARTEGPLLGAEVGDLLGFGIPRHMTPDRFPQFNLLRDVIQDILARAAVADGGRVGDATALRDSAYRKRVGQGGLPAFLWGIGGGDAPPVNAAYGWLVSLVWLPVTRTFPRWWWARRRTGRLIRVPWLAVRRGRGRRWLGAAQNVQPGRDDLFQVLDDLSQRQVPRLRLPVGAPNREEALRTLEDLLLRALLEDLSDPPTGGVLPRRRRRTARPVLLVPIPRPTADPGDNAPRAGERAAEGARRTERFLASFCAAQQTAAAPGPLVIAVGRPSPGLLGQLGNPAEITLGRMAELLREPSSVSPVMVPLSGESFRQPGLPITQVRPRRFRLGWAAATSLVAGGTALAVMLTAFALGDVLWESPRGCVGGTDTVAESARVDQIVTRPTQWYDAAIAAIEVQNDIARKKAVGTAKVPGRTVRTVVVFVSNRPTVPENTLFDGTIPELRGIALWQQKLNKEAGPNAHQVPLIVDVRETGVAFHDAEQKARELVDEIGAGRDLPDYEQVIGVLGFAQSRHETKAALKVLEEARILAIGTTATADEMLGQQNYWPLTPLNSREAAIEADFATSFGIVAHPDHPDRCEPARRAVVIESYGDLYSRSLADKFMQHFKGEGQSQAIDFTQGSGGDPVDRPPNTPSYHTAGKLADRVCEEITDQPNTVIFWSARAADFTAFINEFNTRGTCTRNNITVLGGDELTNVSQTDAFSKKQWLRLYFSAHRLPAADPRASTATRNFVDEYKTFVKLTTKGEDPWLEDGHAAVAYDAFHVLSQVADLTYGGDNSGAAPSDMQRFFGTGTPFSGATGYIRYEQGVNQPPRDKTLVLLRQTGRGPVAVAVCGAYDQDQSTAKQSAPCASAPR